MNPIKDIQENKKELLLIIITALLFAFSINIFAAYVFATLKQWYVAIGISALLLVAGFIILSKYVLSTTTKVYRFQGAISFIYKKKDILPAKIYGYDFNDYFCKYLNAFVHENEAFNKLLLKKTQDVVFMRGKFDIDNLDFYTIINSVIEYMILNELSLHLNDYYVENEIDDEDIIVLSRDDIDPSILKNRVVDLITKNMCERPLFSNGNGTQIGKEVQSKDGNDDQDEDIEVYYQDGNKGAIYERLELELPPNSILFRNSDGFVVVRNKIFDLTIIPKFEGFGTSVHPLLLECPFENHVYSFCVNFKISLKAKAIISREALDMYAWLDSFLCKMKEYISIDDLERKLNVDYVKYLVENKIITISKKK